MFFVLKGILDWAMNEKKLDHSFEYVEALNNLAKALKVVMKFH